MGVSFVDPRMTRMTSFCTLSSFSRLDYDRVLDPNHSQWRGVSHSDTAGTDDVVRCLLKPWLSTRTVLSCPSFVDWTCVLYISILSKRILRYLRLFERDSWHCLSYCFVVKGAPQGLDWFRTPSLGTSVTPFPAVPGQQWLLCGCRWLFCR